MSTKFQFQCCKLKGHSNYVCINCVSVYHKSCLERKQFVIIKDHLVNCCNQTNRVIDVTVLQGLKERIALLEQDAEMLHKNNKRLKNQITTTQQDNIEMEAEFLALNKNLNEKIADYEIKNCALLRKLTMTSNPTCTNKIMKTACTQTRVSSYINTETQTFSTQTITAATQTKILSKDHWETQRDINRKCADLGQIKQSVPDQQKMILLADDYGKGLINKLQNQLPLWKIRSELKPAATLQQVCTNIDATLNELNKQDFLVIIAGSNDLRRRTNLTTFQNIINCIVSKSSQTNIIISTIPQDNCKSSSDTYLDQLNSIIWSTTKKFKNVAVLPFIAILDKNDFTVEGTYLTYNGKVKLCCYIAFQCQLTSDIANRKIEVIINKRTINKKYNVACPKNNIQIQLNSKGVQHNKNIHNKENKMNKFRIMHLNIQSLRNKTNSLELLLDSLTPTPHVIGISEHWLDPYEKDSMYLNQLIISSCYVREAGNNAHGGSCILLHRSLEYIELTDITALSIERQIEISAVMLEKFNLIIVCIYRPSGADINIFMASLQKMLEKLEPKILNNRNRLCLCGDFNLDLDCASCKIEAFIDLLNSFQLKPTITEKTRITKTSATRIDNIFINDFKYKESKVIHTDISDHSAQTITFPIVKNFHASTKKKKIKKTRSFKEEELQHAFVDLANYDFSTVMKDFNVNSACSYFSDLLKYNINRYFPKKINKDCSKIKPWITKGIRVSSEKKKRTVATSC